MPDITLGAVADVFPPGTSVGAYPITAWPVTPPSGAPAGSASQSQTVGSAGTLAFTGLAEGLFGAAAQVGGVWRIVQFSTRRDLEVDSIDVSAADDGDIVTWDSVGGGLALLQPAANGVARVVDQGDAVVPQAYLRVVLTADHTDISDLQITTSALTGGLFDVNGNRVTDHQVKVVLDAAGALYDLQVVTA